MGAKPWEGWIPGVLSDGQLRELCEAGHIEEVILWDSTPPR